ncbi:MAG: TolB-like translocation protein, partial [Solirubrobacteraceae bacterium]
MALATCGFAMALASVCLGGVGLAVAGAEGCSNAALRTGPSEKLPDCRGYEQVSPEEKGGFEAPFNEGLEFTSQASTLGDSLSFMAVGSIVPSQGSGLPDTFVASHTSSGWQTVSVTPPTPEAPPTTITEYGYGFDFSADLANIVIKVPFQSLAPEPERATPGVYNLFLRHPNGSYALVTAASPSTPPTIPCLLCFEETDLSAFMGANTGTPAVGAFTHILFEVDESLLTTPLVPSEQLVPNLYESNMEEPSSQRVHPVGVLPDGSVTAGGSVAGAGMSYEHSSVINTTAGDGAVARAISNDGSHVLFQATADGGAPDPEQAGITELYDRIDGSATIEISAPAPGSTPANPAPEPATYWTASVDGQDVYFTSPAELTSASNTGTANEGNDLYRYEVATHELTDLSVDASDPAGASVLGVVGASEDGSYVYFVASGQLEAGHGVPGEPNLYVEHNGVAHFIATLNPSDASLWTGTATQASGYVTPDGRHLAFASVSQLTSYDNHDQNEPSRADREVYEYDATGPSLVCASCNPSGARPVAEASITVLSTPFHHPRILNDDGSRLFFVSNESLDGASGGGLFEFSGGAAHIIAPKEAEFLDAS